MTKEKKITIKEFKARHYKPKGDFFILRNYEENVIEFYGNLRNFSSAYRYAEVDNIRESTKGWKKVTIVALACNYSGVK